jgi:hypothetical protein
VAAQGYFTANPEAPDRHDAYFNNFTAIWRAALETGNSDLAESIWPQALAPASQWEQAQPGRRLHKGTPYYFWAMTALLRGDIDHGYILIHQALAEDVRTHQQARPNTPGYALVSLNYQRVDQAFRSWTIDQATFFERLINNYRTTFAKQLTIDDVKRRFIDNSPTIEILFLVTYTLARLRKISAEADYARRHVFAGMVELNLLFDSTVIIDEAIKHKNPARQHGNGRPLTFIHQAEYLLRQEGHALAPDELGEMNGQFNANFDVALKAALNGTHDAAEWYHPKPLSGRPRACLRDQEPWRTQHWDRADNLATFPGRPEHGIPRPLRDYRPPLSLRRQSIIRRVPSWITGGDSICSRPRVGKLTKNRA